jgi:hypothetical protein
LKRLAAIAALSVAVALPGAASGASGTRWQLLSYQNAHVYAIARTSTAVYPGDIAVRFHGVGFVTFYCEGGSAWSWRRFWNPGFHALPFFRKQYCVVEAEAWSIGEGFPIPDGLTGSTLREWGASVAIYTCPGCQVIR